MKAKSHIRAEVTHAPRLSPQQERCRAMAFFGFRARFGDGWHNNRPGVSSPRSTGLRPRLGTCFYLIKPAAITLVAEKMSFFCNKASLPHSPTLRVPSWIRLTLCGNWADARIK